ncbi:MAG: hypothetical protein Kapaf2KO_21770 [Candidatus Kapaibacteriales bacterium]
MTVENSGALYYTMDNFNNTCAVIDSRASDFLSDSATTVKYSSDGGNSWQTIFADSTANVDSKPGEWIQRVYYGIQIPSDTDIYLIGYEKLRDGNPLLLYPFLKRSNDKGKTWERIEICGSRFANNQHLISMYSSQSGFIYSSDCETDNSPALYFTQNGFDSKARIDLPPTLTGFNAQYIKAIDENKVIIGAGPIGNQRIYYTKDQGLNWEEQPIKLENENEFVTMFDVNEDENIFAISTKPSNQGSLNIATVYKSTDLGSSWDLLFEQNDDFMSFAEGIDFLDNQRGIIAGGGVVLVTQDGGVTWDKQITPPEHSNTARIFGITYNSENLAYIKTDKNLIRTEFQEILQSPILSLEVINSESLEYKLNWEQIETAEEYALQVAEFPYAGTVGNSLPPSEFENGFVFEKLILTNNSYLLSQDIVFKNKKQYFCRVKAYTASDSSNWSNFLSFQTPIKQGELGIPVLVSPQENQKVDDFEDVTFQWEDLATAEKYHIFVTLDPDSINPITDIFALNIIPPKYRLQIFLQPNTRYYWYIKAIKGSEESNSAVRSFTTGEILSVEQNLESESAILFPNTLIEGENVKIEGVELEYPFTMSFYDYTGSKITEINVKNNNFNAPDLKRGIYFVNIPVNDKPKYYMLMYK